MAQRRWLTRPALKGVRLQPGGGGGGEDTLGMPLLPHPALMQLQALILCILTVTLCNEAYYPHFAAGETEAGRR